MIRGVARYLLPGLSLLLLTGTVTCRKPEDPRTACERAVTIASHDYPQRRLDWALSTLQSCEGAGADAAAHALLSMRSATDTLSLDAQTDAINGWRDSALFGAGLQLASDRGATKESRVFALRYLLSLVQPGMLASYGDFARKSEHWCMGQAIRTDMLTEGRPLPIGYVEIIRVFGTRASEDAANPLEVRLAASCLSTIPKGYSAPKPYGVPNSNPRAKRPGAART